MRDVAKPASPLVLVPLDRIEPTPDDPRRRYGIEELADSIERHGLLHNLVVRQADATGMHELMAGERRYRALTLLAQRGRLPNRNIECFVVPSDGFDDGAIRRMMRADAPPWELAAIYLNFHGAGLTMREIATRAGKNPANVSLSIYVARRLAPAVQVRLREENPTWFPLSRLGEICGRMSEASQLERFEELLTIPRRIGRPPGPHTALENLWTRYQLLKRGKAKLRVDPAFRPFLESVLNYLAGYKTTAEDAP